MQQSSHVVVLGAGYGGLMAAMRLAKKTRPEVAITRTDGTPVVAVSIEVDGSRIRTVWAIGNPDKLRAV
jgi:NADH dehydrogenase FAD-containing subunit